MKKYESIVWIPEEETLGHLLNNLEFKYTKIYQMFMELPGLYVIILEL